MRMIRHTRSQTVTFICVVLVLLTGVPGQGFARESVQREADACTERRHRADPDAACTSIASTAPERDATTPPAIAVRPTAVSDATAPDAPEPATDAQNVETPEPGTMPETPGTDPPPQEAGHITIATYGCDSGYTGGPPLITDPCEEQPGVTFTSTQNGKTVATTTSQAGQYTNGMAYLDEHAPGFATITVALPANQTTMAVHCGFYVKAGGGPPYGAMAVVGGTTVTVEVAPGKLTLCYWLLSAPPPIIDGYFVAINPWVCPLDPVAVIDTLHETCQPASGVIFEAVDATGATHTARAAENGGGSFVVVSLPPGMVTIHGAFPGEITAAPVTCAAVNADGAPGKPIRDVPTTFEDGHAGFTVDPSAWASPGGGVACVVIAFAQAD